MNRKQMHLNAAVFVAWLLVFGASIAHVTEAAVVETPAFDHSNCQYPDRETNPANGCDNSDPAIPECIGKTGSGEVSCTAFVDKCLKAQPTQSYELLQNCVQQYRDSLNPTALIIPVTPPVVEQPVKGICQ